MQRKVRHTGLIEEALTHENQTAEFLQPQEEYDLMNHIILFLAQGFGVGRIPFAPGTWGSLLGVVWSALLLVFFPPAIVAVVVMLSVLLAVWICGEAERIMGEKDPSSIVLDEIVAMPIVYAGIWFLAIGKSLEFGDYVTKRGGISALTELAKGWPVILAGFLLFRLFDIWKPWPIRRLQNLPGGWGVVVDDLAAAFLAAVALLISTLMVIWLLYRT